MIRRKVKVTSVETGETREVVRLTPETEEDLREIDRLREAGLLDHRNSFADDPGAWDE